MAQFSYETIPLLYVIDHALLTYLRRGEPVPDGLTLLDRLYAEDRRVFHADDDTLPGILACERDRIEGGLPFGPNDLPDSIDHSERMDFLNAYQTAGALSDVIYEVMCLGSQSSIARLSSNDAHKRLTGLDLLWRLADGMHTSTSKTHDEHFSPLAQLYELAFERYHEAHAQLRGCLDEGDRWEIDGG